jgi:hypothetical protein
LDLAPGDLERLDALADSAAGGRYAVAHSYGETPSVVAADGGLTAI